MVMGTPVASTFADLFLALWEEKYIFSTDNLFISYIRHWSRFIDDVLIVWLGTQEHLVEFLEYINVNDMNMQFTGNFGNGEVESLNVQISVKDEMLVIKGHRESTTTNALLHYNSYQHPHIK